MLDILKHLSSYVMVYFCKITNVYFQFGYLNRYVY